MKERETERKKRGERRGGKSRGVVLLDIKRQEVLV